MSEKWWIGNDDTDPLFDSGCGARMVAMAAPGHTHVCTGPHDAGDCYCTECGRYFWHAQEKLGER